MDKLLRLWLVFFPLLAFTTLHYRFEFKYNAKMS